MKVLRNVGFFCLSAYLCIALSQALPQDKDKKAETTQELQIAEKQSDATNTCEACSQEPVGIKGQLEQPVILEITTHANDTETGRQFYPPYPYPPYPYPPYPYPPYPYPTPTTTTTTTTTTPSPSIPSLPSVAELVSIFCSVYPSFKCCNVYHLRSAFVDKYTRVSDEDVPPLLLVIPPRGAPAYIEEARDSYDTFTSDHQPRKRFIIGQ